MADVLIVERMTKFNLASAKKTMSREAAPGKSGGAKCTYADPLIGFESMGGRKGVADSPKFGRIPNFLRSF